MWPAFSSGVKLALEALRINAGHPIDDRQVALLEDALAKGQTRLRRQKRARRNSAASNKQYLDSPVKN